MPELSEADIDRIAERVEKRLRERMASGTSNVAATLAHILKTGSSRKDKE